MLLTRVLKQDRRTGYQPSGPLLSRLRRKLAPGELRMGASFCDQYAGDKWFASHPPDAVALPQNTASVSRLLQFANQHRIPVTARAEVVGVLTINCTPSRFNSAKPEALTVRL